MQTMNERVLHREPNEMKSCMNATVSDPPVRDWDERAFVTSSANALSDYFTCEVCRNAGPPHEREYEVDQQPDNHQV